MKAPDPDHFLLVSPAPACPICGEAMVHVEIRSGDIDYAHVWMCSCEPQPGDMAEEIDDCRGEVRGLVMLWRPDRVKAVRCR
jgi:hypothetical protein